MEDLLRVLAVFALIGANAFFVIGEYAVVTARRSAIAARGGRRAAAALRLMEDPVGVISAVQVYITAVGILIGALGEPVIRDLLPGEPPKILGFAIAFVIITYLSVLLGELVPKALTLDRAERLAMLVARPIELLSLVVKPAVWVLQRSSQVLLRPFGITEVTTGDSVRSPEELRAMVDEAEEGGVIGRAQEELLHNVFDFVRQEVRDIMVPAADVVWVDADQDAAAAVAEAVDRPHSRYPVGQGSLNHVVGVVHVRDLVSLSLKGGGTVKDAARPAPFVPETKDVGALLKELREQRQHLAVVGDEYGGTLGIVTLEDVLEELVGEIEDEYDLPGSTIGRTEDGALRVAGSMTVDDFNEQTGAELPQDGPHTMAGLVFDRLGRRADVGDEVAIAGTQLAVDEVDGTRITCVLVTLP